MIINGGTLFKKKGQVFISLFYLNLSFLLIQYEKLTARPP